jgi:hypothetical protein
MCAHDSVCIAHHVVILSQVLGEDIYGDWMLALGHWQGSSCLVWPVEAFPIEGDTYFKLSVRETAPSFVAILDLDRWNAVEVQWRGPLFQWLRYPALRNSRPTLKLFQKGEPAPLLRIAAQAAFWNMPMLALKNFARHLEVDLPAGADMFQILWALCGSILDLDGDALLNIVEKRVVTERFAAGACMPEMLQLEAEGLDWMDKDDQVALKKEQESGRKSKAREDALLAKVILKRKELVGPAGAGEGAAHPAAKKVVYGGMQVGPRIYSGHVPPGEFGQPEAKLLLAPEGHIWKGKCGVWQASMPGHVRCSRAWATYSYRGAMLLCIRYTWECYAKNHNLSVQDVCPFMQIFGEAIAGPAADPAPVPVADGAAGAAPEGH